MDWTPSPNRYDTAHYVRVGTSGLKLPPISLGLWNNFGDDHSFESQRDIVLSAFDRGVTHFDLANNYGPPVGASEANLGRIIATDMRNHRDELIVSTKAGYFGWPGPYGEWGSRKYLLSSLDQSLSRLGVDYVDIFYSHRPDPDTPIEETMGALASAVTSGKALYVGISNYSGAQTRAAYSALAAQGIPLLTTQPRYNMFDRAVEEDVFPVLSELGVGSVVWSPLAQGLLTDRYLAGIPAGSRVSEGRWISADAVHDVYRERVVALNDFARMRGLSLAQLAILWVLRRPEVTSAIVGASSVEQLNNTLDALDHPRLSESEIAEVEPFAVHGT